MKQFLEYAQYVIEILAILGISIEITPIKVSPLKWIGKKINEETNKKIDQVKNKVDDIDKRVNKIEYTNAIKDLGDIRSRIISYGILIRKGEILDENSLKSAMHDLDTYDYYKEKYKYMEVNGRKVKINGEVDVARDLILNEMLKIKKED